MRSLQRELSKTPAFGGDGGEPFSLFEEGAYLSRIEVRSGPKKNQYIQGLIVALSNGTSVSFGTIKPKGQVTWVADFLQGERVTSIVLHKYLHASGGIVIRTTGGTHGLGHRMGPSVEMQFKESELFGVWGRVGADIDCLGFYYTDRNEECFLPRPMPEQRYVWKSGTVAEPTTVANLYRPFETIHEIVLSAREGCIEGISVRYSSGNREAAGHHENACSRIVSLPETALVKEVALSASLTGFLNWLEFATDPNVPVGPVNPPEGDLAAYWKSINAQLVGVQCGWTDEGEMAFLSLLFSSPCTYMRIGRLCPASDSPDAFLNAGWNRALKDISGYRVANDYNGIEFCFSDGTEISKGQRKGDSFDHASFAGASCSLNYVEGSGIMALRENPEAQMAEPTDPGDLEEFVWVERERRLCGHGTIIGAWGHPAGQLSSFGFLFTSSRMVTPLCGRWENGKFFETDCLYSLNRQEVMPSVLTVQSWWNSETKTLHGLQIQRVSSVVDAFHISEIGKLTGKLSRIEIPKGFEVEELEAAVSPLKKGGLCGMQITGKTIDGVQKKLTVGKLFGNVYHHCLERGSRLVGFYGTCHEELPTSIGFVIDSFR